MQTNLPARQTATHTAADRHCPACTAQAGMLSDCHVGDRYALVASETRPSYAYIIDTQSPKPIASVVDAVLYFGPAREAAQLAQVWNATARVVAALRRQWDQDAQEADQLARVAQAGQATARTLLFPTGDR